MATITDRAGNTWAITTGAQVTRNGVVDPATSGTAAGLYWNHVFNRQNNAGTWFAYNAGSWPQTTDPRLATNGLAASPSGSTLTSTTGSIRDSVGRVWTLTAGSQIAINGVTEAVTSGVNLILYWDLVIYHRNTSALWYTYNGTPGNYTQVAGDPRILSRTVTGLVASTSYNFRAFASNTAGAGPVSATATASTLAVTTVGNAPPQAVAAGYTNPVLNSEFDSQSELADVGSAVAAAWYTGSPDGGGRRFTDVGDSNISNSILSLTTSKVSFSANVSSARTNSAVISAPGAIQSPNTSGRYFHYGFFEAKMRFNNNRPVGDLGWPSFWGTSFDDGSVTDHLEIDFMESQGALNVAGQTHNGFLWWFNGAGGDPGAYGEFFGALNATGYPNWSTVLANSGIDQGGGWNIFSCLWTPTALTYYWTSAARRDAGTPDYQVATYPTTSSISGFISNDGGRPVTTNMTQAQANPRFYLILGSNSTANVQFDWVRVWQ